MKTPEIRQSFTDFMVAREHTLVPSASLVPAAFDPSVMLTTAGMQPFKPYFLGEAEPPARRLTSVQKVFRTTDIDEVGTTARHLTFFQMMGNFSFGDYFKPLAIEMAWELSTGPWDLDPDRIWATVYRGDETVPPDDVARDLWISLTGVPAERVVALGGDNFWNAGPTGPCGPCSELYFDRGAAHGCDRPDCAPGCECDRFLEYWNLVFMQYDRAADGSLTPLPAQNIDTGSGLERVAALLQGVHSVYETDAFQAIIGAAETWSGARYDGSEVERKALRVLADHGRAMTMLACDGVMPSNEGRGYILRRIIRRAVLQGSQIGLRDPFLERLMDVVIGDLGAAYPELVRSRDDVRRLLVAEEERFSRTLETGVRLLDEVIAGARARNENRISGEDAFRLHDTYGFPVEVTAEIAADAGLSVDQAGFAELMQAQRERARAAARSAGSGLDAARIASFAREAGFVTEFRGYDRLDLVTGADAVADLEDGRLLVKLRESPFYAEGGGQVSDTGTVESGSGRAAVESVQRLENDQVLVARLEHGSLRPGETVRAIVDREQRRPTVSNHTATHLLHRALRNQLGEHVHQAGSAVRPDKLRFDFTHDSALAPGQLAAIEDEVNAIVLDARPVHFTEMPIDEARALGATMLFGEKYGDIVRVVEIEDYSRELCGGTHASTTAEVGPFRILSEGSTGQGVRRIEAVTGAVALAMLREHDRALEEAARLARTTPSGLSAAIEAMQARIRELEKAGRSDVAADVGALAAQATARNGISVLAAEAPEGILGDDLLALSDRLKGALGPSAVVLGSRDGDSVQLIANLTSEAIEAGLSAADVIRAVAPLVGGGGGGRPSMARAGGKDPAGLEGALTQARELLLRT